MCRLFVGGLGFARVLGRIVAHARRFVAPHEKVICASPLADPAPAAYISASNKPACGIHSSGSSATASHEVPSMIYIFHLLDKPDSAALRQRVRPQHQAYLAAVADRIAFAGPLLADDGQTMLGSVLAIDFDSRQAAQAWQASEPFTRAGLYARSELHGFTNLWPQRAGFAAAA